MSLSLEPSPPSAERLAVGDAHSARLLARLASTIDRLPLHQGSGLASLILPLPFVPALPPALAGPHFRYLRGNGNWQAGYGIAAEWHADGNDRLSRLGALARDWPRVWHRADPDGIGGDAFALFGFAAAPEPRSSALPNALLWVPRVGIRATDAGAALVCSTVLPTTRERVFGQWRDLLNRLLPALCAPGVGPLPLARPRGDRQHPSFATWVELVRAALRGIDERRLEKVVLSRRLEVAGDRCFDIDRLLAILGRLFPSCQILQLRHAECDFVAATPERLLRLRDGVFDVDALAGTAARGTTPAEDAALRTELLQSEKNRREHHCVVEAIRAALAPCVRRIEVPAEPRVMRLRNAQHLWTPLRGETLPGIDVPTLAERLHPTPATNGQPRAAAAAWLREYEPFSRDWYTGAAGLLEPDLSGELWVLLRCALIAGERAELYAGSGIVAGSDPRAEWDETDAKLSAMLTALQYA